ncbi:MAG: nuclear transport factor 2 family protein [Ferruginibacter sp.]
MKEAIVNQQRKEQLKKVAESYFDALKQKNFSAIPFSDEVVLRAPLAPGGVHNPIKGKQAVFEQWWQPLEPALEGVSITIIDHYYNDAMTGIITKAEVTLAGPGITLRVADRFIIIDAGMITEQENHFDASPLRG